MYQPLPVDSAPTESSREVPFDASELSARVRAGDAAAFEALYRRYWTSLYHFAFRYLQVASDAEEIVQNVFFKIWRNRTEWRVVGSIEDYLYGAVRNAARDRLAREAVAQRWRTASIAEIQEASNHYSVAEIIIQTADLDAAVERALAELPMKRRVICSLRLTDGLSYAQIADRLGVSTKTVETQLARGIKFLREKLSALRDE